MAMDPSLLKRYALEEGYSEDDLGAAMKRFADDSEAAMKKMGLSQPTDAGAELPNIECPALVVMGTLDPDWASPQGEAEGIVAQMPAGRGTVVMIEGAGHYPHSQYPDRVAQVLLPFLKEYAGA